MKKYLIIGPILLFLIWLAISQLNFIDPFFLPGPLTTLGELYQLLSQGDILHDLFSSLVRVIEAFLLAAILGVPMGLLLGISEKIYRSCEFIIDFFRSTPATALFPLFLLVFGVSDSSKIAVAAFASFLIIIFNTTYGVMHSGKSKALAAKIMGATRIQIFKKIIFWQSLPQTFVGLRNAVSLSLVIIIVTEMFIGTHSGLGRKIIDFQLVYNIKAMYAAILLAGILGYILNLLFLLAGKKIIHWNVSN